LDRFERPNPRSFEKPDEAEKAMIDWGQVIAFLTAPERVATLIMLCLGIAIWEILKTGISRSVKFIAKHRSPKATLILACFLAALILALWFTLKGGI